MSGYVKLTQKQIESKMDFIKDYTHSENPATGAKLDANANVTVKNLTSMSCEMNKDVNIQVNRKILYNKISKLFDVDTADEYIRQLEDHEIYCHDETSLMPYTYGAREVVNVKYKGIDYLVSFERLYDLCDEEEFVLDEEKGVCGKFPENMTIYDRNGFTKISRLVKKVRHRDLVRVKTAFNNDVIVTDNHPMIVSDDISETVEAKDSLNSNQFRVKSTASFGGVDCLDSVDVLKSAGVLIKNDLDDCVIYQEDSGCKICVSPKKIKLDRELGYFVGFFIGDGDYNESMGSVNITQKTDDVLKRMANTLYTHFGVPSNISYMSCGDKRYGSKYRLSVNDKIVWLVLSDIFRIGHYAQNKTLPENIFEYNRDFAIGIVEGMVDSDGSARKDMNDIIIRVSSRALVCQTAALLGALGISTSMTTQEASFGCNKEIQQKYQLFGISFKDNKDNPIFKCTKFNGSNFSHQQRTSDKRKDEGWVSISNVQFISNDKFLEQNEYIYDITTESNTFVCNGIWVHNCTAISMYPFLTDGMIKLGGESRAPKHLQSFCGSFVNLIYAVACQFAGAVATVEFLTYFDYYARKDYGENYLETNRKEVTDLLQQVVYCLNQPAGARNYQSTFWNISLFDKNYFESLFGTFYFPDFTQPSWESVQKLQNFFMKWFNEERTKALLTFPVVTAAMVVDEEKPIDEQFARDRAQDLSEGNSFFVYESNSVDSLASCCRLRNEMADNDFSYSLGAGGVKSGSINVITINFNRLIQNVAKSFMSEKEIDKETMLASNMQELVDRIKAEVKIQVEKIQKYQVAYRSIMESYKAHKMLPVYDAGFIDLDKQFLTTGINGLVEGCEYLGFEISDNIEYKTFVSGVLKVIYDTDKAGKAKYGYKFNTEYVPAENLGIKNSKWDKESGLEVPRDCYNSYFYKVEDSSLNEIDKFRLHGGDMVRYLDGGSALHLALDDYPDEEQYYKMMCIAAKEGCNYWTTNIRVTVCESCGHIDKHTLDECPVCGSKSISYATRIIGYLKKISSFSKGRQKEAAQRFYHKTSGLNL